jgi:CDP-diacylglycerol--glycerol-3-phosphate 3-phosphatidyltransferase
MHTLLYVFLIHFKADFYNESTNQPLYKINTANRVTLLRLSSLPTIAFLLRHKELVEIKTLLPILLILLFLTDSFDGHIARHRKQITKMGQMLDSISDYSLLAVISVVYFQNNIVPHWFFYLIFIRLFLQAFGMLIFIIMKKPVEIKSTWGGKITIATTMVLYVLELVKLWLPHHFDNIFKILEYISGAIILILYLEKARIFFRQGEKLKNEGKNI